MTGALNHREGLREPHSMRRRGEQGRSGGSESATYGQLLGTAMTLLWPKVISRRESVVLVVMA
jgi:hypothetical protein